MYLLKVSKEIVIGNEKVYVNALRIPFDSVKEAHELGKVIANSNKIDDAMIYVAIEIDKEYDEFIHVIERDWYLDYE